jgi:hypothetical protein
MSAPTSSAPLVVNTRDGACWTRRTVTEGGIALYALADVCKCPEFVMATLAELAERGIVGSADVLPVPVGPERQAVSSEQRAQIAELIGGAKPATDGLLLEMAQQIRDRREHDHSTAADWDWYCLNASGWLGDKAPTVLRRLLDGEARVAELEAERHSTNEALSDITVALREKQDAPLTVFRAEHDSIPFGLYTTAETAREHCEAHERRDRPDINLDWIEDEEDGVAELTAWIGGEECTTGYVVTALEVASKYDPDADE